MGVLLHLVLHLALLHVPLIHLVLHLVLSPLIHLVQPPLLHLVLHLSLLQLTWCLVLMQDNSPELALWVCLFGWLVSFFFSTCLSGLRVSSSLRSILFKIFTKSTCMYVYFCLCVCMCVSVFSASVCVCIYVCDIYIYIYIYIHIYIYITRAIVHVLENLVFTFKIFFTNIVLTLYLIGVYFLKPSVRVFIPILKFNKMWRL